MSRQNNPCPYNREVVCGPQDWKNKPAKRDCNNCGWNPEVAKKRLEKRNPTTKTEKSQENY